jgi:AcrR family transcriptional regulator
MALPSYAPHMNEPLRRTVVRRADRRSAIIEIALEILPRRPDATMAEIAAAAGTSEGTLFYAFTDRGELLGECLHRLVHDPAFITAMRESLDHGDLEARVTALATTIRSNMLTVVPIIFAAMRTPNLGPGPTFGGFGHIDRAVAEVLATGAEWAAPIEELCGEFIGLLFGQVSQAQMTGLPLPPIERTVATFLYGALPRPT